MTQENGMPIRFQLRIDEEIVGYEKWCPSVSGNVDGRLFLKPNSSNWTWDYIPHTDKDQAIGATSSDDPPQELYLGDVIEIEYEPMRVVGEIVWRDFSVVVKYYWMGEISYMRMDDVIKHPVKYLGSCHDPKIKGVLKKAGLEEIQ